jgi:hypothetical protein
MQMTGFSQHVVKHTTDYGSLLDHVWVNIPWAVSRVPELIENYWSDHQAVLSCIQICMTKDSSPCVEAVIGLTSPNTIKAAEKIHEHASNFPLDDLRPSQDSPKTLNQKTTVRSPLKRKSIHPSPLVSERANVVSFDVSSPVLDGRSLEGTTMDDRNPEQQLDWAFFRLLRNQRIIGDGNCLFRALLVASSSPEGDHMLARRECSSFISANWDRYSAQANMIHADLASTFCGPPIRPGRTFSSSQVYSNYMNTEATYASNLEAEAFSILVGSKTRPDMGT